MSANTLPFPITSERTQTKELPFARSRAEIAEHALSMLMGKVPGFTIHPEAFGKHTTSEGFQAIADSFPDHKLAGGEEPIGTPSGKTIEIAHTDREATFPSGTRDSLRLHRIEPFSPSGAHITLGAIEDNPDIAAGTTFEESANPDAHEVTYHTAHAEAGHYTVFDANKLHQFVNDKELGLDENGDLLVRASTITDLVQKDKK